MKRPSLKCMKILKTCNLYLCFFVLGLCVAVPGPCLLDLEHLVQTDTQDIAFIYTARSIGYLVGALFGGILLDAIRSKQAVLTICNFIMALSMLAMPWSKNLATLNGFMVVNGLTLGAIDTGGNVVCLTLWGSDSGPYYQALHLTFGIGGLMAPLITAPFLGDYSEVDYTTINDDNATYFHNFTNLTTQVANHSHFASLENTVPSITWPFLIIGVFGLVVSFSFLAVCITSPYEERTSHKKRSAGSRMSVGFISLVVLLNFLLVFVENGIETGYAQMITTYAVKSQLKLSTSTGSYMTSVFWAAFTISRFASVFLAVKVSSFTLLVSDLIITVIGSLVFLFLASYEWAIWFSSVLLGVGVASFYPAAVGWLDCYVDVTNKIASVFAIGYAIGQMVIPLAISHFIESLPDVLLYTVFISSISTSLIAFILYLILRKREKKDARGKPESSVLYNSSVHS